MSDKLWRTFAYGFFIANTCAVIILIEILAYGKPFGTLFLLIFAGTLYLNRNLFKKKPPTPPKNP